MWLPPGCEYSYIYMFVSLWLHCPPPGQSATDTLRSCCKASVPSNKHYSSNSRKPMRCPPLRFAPFRALVLDYYTTSAPLNLWAKTWTQNLSAKKWAKTWGSKLELKNLSSKLERINLSQNLDSKLELKTWAHKLEPQKLERKKLERKFGLNIWRSKLEGQNKKTNVI